MKNKGFTLLECILSLALSFILIDAVMEVCGIAYHLLLKERVLYDTAVHALELARVLRADLTKTQSLSCAWQQAPWVKLVASDEHRLTVQHVDDEQAYAVTVVDPAQLEITSALKELKNNHFLMSDCVNAEFVQIDSYSVKSSGVLKVVLKNPLKYAYKQNAKLYPWVVHQYFIQKNMTGMPALYLKSDQHIDEWLSRVNEMKVAYHEHYVQLDFKLGEQAIQVLSAYRALL